MSIVGEIEFAHGYDVGRGPACPDETCYLLPVVLKDIGDPGRYAVLKPAPFKIFSLAYGNYLVIMHCLAQ